MTTYRFSYCQPLATLLSNQYCPKRSSHLTPGTRDVSLEAPKPKPKTKIILFTKSVFRESPQTKNRKYDEYNKSDEEATKKPKHGSSGFEDEPDEDEDEETMGRTRSERPKLSVLETSSHSRPPNVYPSHTPWGWYGMHPVYNDLYPRSQLFQGDHSDVPDLDLGERLEKLNFWEGPWIEVKEEKKVIDERERKRKRQQRSGGLTAAGRKRAYKKRAGAMPERQNGMLEKLAVDYRKQLASILRHIN
ncbi:hypothetical protein N431DRAFT_452290 [Stipitochalara longipes BDJ]|nr:hypothetical protein N431DRAFT_452290 [Stipitochalara longipes BDJ]